MLHSSLDDLVIKKDVEANNINHMSISQTNHCNCGLSAVPHVTNQFSEDKLGVWPHLRKSVQCERAVGQGGQELEDETLVLASPCRRPC